MNPFLAFRIHQDDGKVVARLETIALDALSAGEVVVKVSYSGINFKDALAATGAGKILRKYPLVGGIDLAGTVVASTDASVAVGQKVLVNGCGLSETHDGGYAEYARLKPEWVIPIPSGLDEYQCMALGTAGFTAALAIHRMEHNGQRPDGGEIVVTGASGGVGSLAIDMLSARGFQAVALTGKASAEGYLRDLGAVRVMSRGSIKMGTRPLEEALWAGAIDNVGGEVLTWLTRTTNFWGNIASIGMANSVELKSTVQRLASDLKPRHLDEIVTRIIGLDQLPAAFVEYLKGSVVGRTVVRI
jgi:NADPH2:quinone reductase